MFETFSYYFTLTMAIMVLCTFLGVVIYSVLGWYCDTLWKRMKEYHTLQGCRLLLGLLYQEGIKVTPERAYKIVDFMQAEKIKEEENE